MLNIPKDFREFIELLDKNNVRYLVVGGYAVAYYGYPRSTGDIDFFIESTPENAAAVYQCLIDFGFASLNISIEDLSTPETILHRSMVFLFMKHGKIKKLLQLAI